VYGPQALCSEFWKRRGGYFCAVRAGAGYIGTFWLLCPSCGDDGKMYHFFSLSMMGIIGGMIEAAIWGFVFGFIFAWLYNHCPFLNKHPKS